MTRAAYYSVSVPARARGCAASAISRAPCHGACEAWKAEHQGWQMHATQRGQVRRAPPEATERHPARRQRLRSTWVSREACGLSRNDREQRRNHDSPGFYGRSSAPYHSSSLWEPANMLYSRGRQLLARAGRLGRPASTGKCNISTRSDAGTTEKRRSRSRCAAARARAAAARG